MRKKDESTARRMDLSEADEVEILEVVGLEDDDSARPPSGDPEEYADPDPDEVVVSLDDDDDDPPGPSAAVASDERRQLMRLRADYDNLRKRIDRERLDYRRFANSSLVGRLLPVLDNFERALAVGAEGANGDSFLEGVTMIRKQLDDELRREGLRVIDAVGQPFDPEVHEAVATDDRSDEPTNTVIQEMQRGYLFHDRVLRPALVKVATRGAAAPSNDAGGEEGGSS